MGSTAPQPGPSARRGQSSRPPNVRPRQGRRAANTCHTRGRHHFLRPRRPRELCEGTAHPSASRSARHDPTGSARGHRSRRNRARSQAQRTGPFVPCPPACPDVIVRRGLRRSWATSRGTRSGRRLRQGGRIRSHRQGTTITPTLNELGGESSRRPVRPPVRKPRRARHRRRPRTRHARSRPTTSPS